MKFKKLVALETSVDPPSFMVTEVNVGIPLLNEHGASVGKKDISFHLNHSMSKVELARGLSTNGIQSVAHCKHTGGVPHWLVCFGIRYWPNIGQ